MGSLFKAYRSQNFNPRIMHKWLEGFAMEQRTAMEEQRKYLQELILMEQRAVDWETSLQTYAGADHKTQKTGRTMNLR